VGAVVIADQVQVQLRRHRFVNGLEKVQEFLGAVAPVVLGDHRTPGRIERDE
jgi:hypothetical protein